MGLHRLMLSHMYCMMLRLYHGNISRRRMFRHTGQGITKASIHIIVNLPDVGYCLQMFLVIWRSR